MIGLEQDERYNNITVMLIMKSSKVIFTIIGNCDARLHQLHLYETRESESAV